MEIIYENYSSNSNDSCVSNNKIEVVYSPGKNNKYSIDDFEYVLTNSGVFILNNILSSDLIKNKIIEFVDSKLISNPQIQQYEMQQMINDNFQEYIKNVNS